MTTINPTIQAFTPPSSSQTNRGAQVNMMATPVSENAELRAFDKSSTGIQIDNESLSTFPTPATASAISLMLDRAVSTISTVSPLTAQSTSPNPKVPSLMSPTPESSVASFPRVYA